jgi:hypothetical protein
MEVRNEKVSACGASLFSMDSARDLVGSACADPNLESDSDSAVASFSSATA